jgi:hypothetical protein
MTELTKRLMQASQPTNALVVDKDLRHLTYRGPALLIESYAAGFVIKHNFFVCHALGCK